MNEKTVIQSTSKIFLSHAYSDNDAAKVIHNCIDDTFRGLLRVFRSSDEGRSIQIGNYIKNEIKSALKDSVAAICLLSHTSINRPWINAEFGAVWMLDTPIIPVLLPGLQANDLPFQFSDMKVSKLANPEDCVEFIRVLHDKVTEKYPFRLKENEIISQGENLYKEILEVSKLKKYVFDESPPGKRMTLWILGSYTDLQPNEVNLIKRLIPILAKGFVDLRLRTVMGETPMLLDFAHQIRDAVIGSSSSIPNPIILCGKIRERNLRYLFLDCINTIPDLALLLGGGIKRGRVQEEYEMAIMANIPIIVIPATGGVATQLNSTAKKAEEFYNILHRTENLDIGNLANSILRAVSKFSS